MSFYSEITLEVYRTARPDSNNVWQYNVVNKQGGEGGNVIWREYFRKKKETCGRTHSDGLGLSLGLHDKLQAARKEREITNCLKRFYIQFSPSWFRCWMYNWFLCVLNMSKISLINPDLKRKFWSFAVLSASVGNVAASLNRNQTVWQTWAVCWSHRS